MNYRGLLKLWKVFKMGVYQITCPKSHPVELSVSNAGTTWGQAYCSTCHKIFTSENSGTDTKSLVFIKM